jgi:Tol biopolymer transport system component
MIWPFRTHSPAVVVPSPSPSPVPFIKPGVLNLPLGFSWQNPAWSPDGTRLSLTCFGRYNDNGSRAFVYNLRSGGLTKIADDAVTQPGACWHPLSGIIMSRTVDDEDDSIWSWSGGELTRLLALKGMALYEPSWGPGRSTFCFEAHRSGDESNGRIGVSAAGRSVFITRDGMDCRQPNWDALTNRIVYQRQVGKDIWSMYVQAPHADSPITKTTLGTDATWTPGGNLLFSGEGGLFLFNLVTEVTVEVGPRGKYKGAASMSPDGKWIACEASDRDPDGGPGTRIEVWPVT